MSKVKFRVGITYIILVICCILYGQFLLIFNYTLALLLHEMAHYYVSRNKGYKVNNIKLDLLGMKLCISENIDKNDHFWIALAGPLLNITLCVFCFALWWLWPESYYFTENFFQANFILAIFNLMPIEPLDGGTMLNSLLSKGSRKVSLIISKTLDIAFIVVFVILFIISFDTEPNLILLLFAIFFTLNLFKQKKTNEYDLYYKMLFKRNQPISKVNLLKVSADTTLYECFKTIKENNYTVFYYPSNKPLYITETELQLLITKYDLQTKIKYIAENRLFKQ